MLVSEVIAHWMRFFMIPFNPLTFFSKGDLYILFWVLPRTSTWVGLPTSDYCSWQNNVCTLMSTPVSTQRTHRDNIYDLPKEIRPIGIYFTHGKSAVTP